MKLIDPNYVPPEPEQFQDGKYKVNRVEWFTKDESTGLPCLVAQKNGKLVGRLRFSLLDGRIGPPMSLALGDMNLFAKAFGVQDLPTVPEEHEAGKIGPYMLELQGLINKLSKELEVEVKGGWVNIIPGMTVPVGYYYFVLSDITPRKDNRPVWTKGDWGAFFFVEFTVVAGEGGSETPYKGSKFTELLSYSVENVGGQVDWAKTQTGNMTAAAKRMSDVMRNSAPYFTQVEDIQFPDPNNILPFWESKLSNPPQVMKGSRTNKDGRIVLDFSSLQPVSTFQIQPAVVKPPANNQPALNSVDKQAQKFLGDLLAKLSNMQVIGPDGEIMQQAGAVAREYITPAKQAGKVKGTKFSTLSFDDILAVVEMLGDKATVEERDTLNKIGLGLVDEPLKIVENEDWGDSPF